LTLAVDAFNAICLLCTVPRVDLSILYKQAQHEVKLQRNIQEDGMKYLLKMLRHQYENPNEISEGIK